MGGPNWEKREAKFGDKLGHKLGHKLVTRPSRGSRAERRAGIDRGDRDLSFEVRSRRIRALFFSPFFRRRSARGTPDHWRLGTFWAPFVFAKPHAVAVGKVPCGMRTTSEREKKTPGGRREPHLGKKNLLCGRRTSSGEEEPPRGKKRTVYTHSSGVPLLGNSRVTAPRPPLC